MSGSLTPYDKKAYRESKRRRKQALKAEKTGRIMPLNIKKRRFFISICIAAAVVLSAVGGYFAFSHFNKENSENNQSVAEIEDNELLTVVNPSNSFEMSYVPPLDKFGDFEVNTLMLDSIEEMFDGAASEGVNLRIINAYIPFDVQQQMYEQKFEELLANPDYTQVRAESEAQRTIPKGGNSEFQTGLLVDFDITNEKTSAWLERNCVKYGFILRYPEGSETVCNHTPSNSIYRYVGKEHAVNIRSYNMYLEDYKSYLSIRQG